MAILKAGDAVGSHIALGTGLLGYDVDGGRAAFYRLERNGRYRQKYQPIIAKQTGIGRQRLRLVALVGENDLPSGGCRGLLDLAGGGYGRFPFLFNQQHSTRHGKTAVIDAVKSGSTVMA
jgi:hypothetical protein